MDAKAIVEVVANASKILVVLAPALGFLAERLEIHALIHPRKPSMKWSYLDVKRLCHELGFWKTAHLTNTLPYDLLLGRLLIVASLGVQAMALSQLGSLFAEEAMRATSAIFWGLTGFYALYSLGFAQKFQGGYIKMLEVRVEQMIELGDPRAELARALKNEFLKGELGNRFG